MLDEYFSHQRINKDTPIPLYYQIKEILLGYIKQSAMGTVIPTENELCELYEVSRPTVRQAMKELENSGLVYRQKAKGSFVGEGKLEQEIRASFEDFEDRMHRHNRVVRKEVIEFHIVPADPLVARKLSLTEGEDVYKIRTVRYADQVPMVLTLTYLPCGRTVELTAESVQQYSMRELISRNNAIKTFRKSFEVKEASDYEITLFGLRHGECMQYVETVCCNGNGQPVEYTMERYRGDRSKFTITFNTAGN